MSLLIVLSLFVIGVLVATWGGDDDGPRRA